VRGRLETVLSSADLRPGWLTSSSVLIVRRLPDPLPGTLPLDPSAGVPPAWGLAVAGALQRALEQAARPAAGWVPAGAEAVRFSDGAELLACLASDWLEGSLRSRWWWRRLPMPGGSDPVEAWLRHPRWVPAALELLAARDEATGFARRLPVLAAQRLSSAVADAFGVVRGSSVVLAPDASGGPGRPSAEASATAPPWEPWVPEADADHLAAEQRLLLGLGLVLRRSPALARGPGFWVAANGWGARGPGGRPGQGERAASLGRLDRAAAPPGGPRGQDRRSRPRPAGGGKVPGHDAAGRDASPGPAAAGRHRLGSGPRPEPDGAPADAAPTGEATGRAPALGAARAPRVAPGRPAAITGDRPTRGPVSDATGHGDRQDGTGGSVARPGPAEAAGLADGRLGARRSARVHPVAATSSPMAAPPDPAPQPAHRLWPAPTDPPDQVVDTDLGGLFYLINLGQALGLYGDFTAPAAPGIGLDLWDFLTLLGGRLLGRPLPGDPVWALLGQLARRGPAEPPGLGFDPPRAWRVPADWLVPFDHGGVWCWSAAGGRLRLRHPAGFAVLDLPRTRQPPAAQLARELRRLRLPTGAVVVRRALSPLPAGPLPRWVALLAGYASARLARALGHPPERVAGVLLRHRARVVVTPVHVDVVLSLAELPVEVRLGGLDRDPGWVPATGRDVRFRFE
jgi:hypothetical protein